LSVPSWEIAVPRIVAILALVAAIFLAGAASADPPAGDAASLDARLQKASQAIEASPRDPRLYRQRAALHAGAGDHRAAIADLDRVIELDPQAADALDERGSQHFMAGQIDESIADFDRYLTLRPADAPRHWKRGISYYYAGQFEAGQRQFEAYQQVDGNDVENAVWRFLCMARRVGVPAAQADMLKIGRDARVPMMEVYALYSGKAKPDDVLRAVSVGDPSPEGLNARLFYAHLYLGLFYEVSGESRPAREHILEARGHKIGHYMWNVADVHTQRLASASKR
jgi:lipoprotein NlpI